MHPSYISALLSEDEHTRFIHVCSMMMTFDYQITIFQLIFYQKLKFSKGSRCSRAHKTHCCECLPDTWNMTVTPLRK